MKNKIRTIITTDIHGCRKEFEELLNKINYSVDNDRLILLGDNLDRGPDSVGVVRLAREMNLECIVGNHELKFLKWLDNRNAKSQSYYKDFSDQDIDYIRSMPSYIKIDDNFLAVHGGIKPNIAIEKQVLGDLAYLRFTDADRKFISLKKIYKGEVTDAKFWTEFGPFGTNVVYGHHVHSTESIKIDKQRDGFACYGLDTGCVFGGRLSCLVLETLEVVQVQAKQIYFKMGFE